MEDEATSAGAVLPPLYVLVGGASRRFGRPKATAPLNGVAWAIDVGRRLAGPDNFTLVGECMVDASSVRRIGDAPVGAGPLSGLLAALEDRQAESGPGWLTLVSCDLVQPAAAWLSPLLRVASESPAVSRPVAYHAEDRWQPFPSLWHTDAADAVRVAIGHGRRSFQRVLEELSAERVAWPGPGTKPPQANTPQELRRLAPEVRLE